MENDETLQIMYYKTIGNCQLTNWGYNFHSKEDETGDAIFPLCVVFLYSRVIMCDKNFVRIKEEEEL